ncbi:MAG: transposase [Methanothrix sp.]|uniref:RNA-guided endonuclease InsQ/TnpB family protein n=1 Tax=Methanothrix sp. TaxID=90426 RepID=UPI001B6F3592|nr:transposase [Methanothrix sp.]MBP7068669.1 transposase [Methanothrix sp.]
MVISYKYRIYPNKATEQKLNEALDTCRWLYDRLLQEMNEAKESGIALGKLDTQNMIPSLKLVNPNLRKVYSKALQMVNYTLWSNIKSLSASKKNGRKIGHLRFKGKGWYKTINYNQSGFKIDQDHSLLHLSKIGDIKIKLHRKIEGTIKAVLIKKSGKEWYAVVQTEPEPSMPDPETRTVGLDVGLKSFAVDTDGKSVENPRFAERAATKVKNIQRRLSRAKKGSNNRQKLRDKLDKVHERINNRRSDFLHKLSRYYVNNYDIICVEDLDVKGLKEKGHNKSMHRNIHDASWSKFIFMLSYKAESAGRKLIKVDPRDTTQRCSACGSIVKKELCDRVHECPYCGFSCDRDYNASRNILFAGMEQPVAPIEPKPLHHISVMQVLAMKWEAAPLRTR